MSGAAHLVRNHIAMPRNEIEWAVVLTSSSKPAVDLVDNLIRYVKIVLNPGHRVEKVSWISKSMTTDWPKIRKFPHRAPYLSDVSTCFTDSRSQFDAESKASLNYGNLTGLQEHPA